MSPNIFFIVYMSMLVITSGILIYLKLREKRKSDSSKKNKKPTN